MPVPSTAQVRVRVTAVSGTEALRLYYSQSANNWGAALEATVGDWTSTDDSFGDDATALGANTYLTFDLNPAAIDWDNPDLYFMIRTTNENAGSNAGTTIATQNNATADYHPKLVLGAAVGGVPQRTLMGVGR